MGELSVYSTSWIQIIYIMHYIFCCAWYAREIKTYKPVLVFACLFLNYWLFNLILLWCHYLLLKWCTNYVLQDFAEHGIAPRKFQTSDSFLSEDRKRRRDQAVKSATMDTLLGSTTALADLIVPEKSVVTLVVTSCTLRSSFLHLFTYTSNKS